MSPLPALTFLVLIVLSASQSIAQVTITSRESWLNSSELLFDGSGSSEMDVFSGEGNYDKTVTANSITTSQNSMVNPSVFEVQIFSDAGLVNGAEGLGNESASGLNVNFEVTSAVFYSLEGVFDYVLYSPDPNSGSSMSVELWSDTISLFSASSVVDTQTDFSFSGILLPGNHTLLIESYNLLDSNSTTRSVISADVSMVVTAVPEPSSTCLLGIASLVVGFRRRKRPMQKASHQRKQ